MLSGPYFSLIPVRLAGDEIIGLIPGRLRQFTALFLPDQGGLQAVGMVDEIEAEPSLDAEAALVGLLIRPVAGDLDDPVVVDVEIHLAADAAVGAGRLDLLDFPGTSGEAGLLEGDGPDRAGIGAFAAEIAVGIDIVGIEGRTDLGPGAAHGEIENLVDLDLVAGPDAAAAEDAFVEIPLDHGVGLFDFIAGGVDVEAGLFDPEPVDQVLQFAGAVLFAGQAVVIPGGPEQLDDQSLRMRGPSRCPF